MTETLARHPDPAENGISPALIEAADWNAVPADALRLMHEEQIAPEGLLGLARLQHPNGDATLFATYPGMSDGFIDETDTLVIDHTTAGDVTGAGLIQYFNRFKGASDMVGYPFVGFTKTNPDLLRQGLAERRLLTMNAFALTAYNQPLRSGVYLAPEIKPLWQKMVKAGMATKLGRAAAFQYSLR